MVVRKIGEKVGWMKTQLACQCQKMGLRKETFFFFKLYFFKSIHCDRAYLNTFIISSSVSHHESELNWYKAFTHQVNDLFLLTSLAVGIRFCLKSDVEELSRWTAAGSGRALDDQAWYRPALGSKKELQCREYARLKEASSNHSCKSGSLQSCGTHTWDVRTTLAAQIRPCLSNADLLRMLMGRFVTFGSFGAVWMFALKPSVTSGRSGTFFPQMKI